MSNTSRPYGQVLCPWDSPGKNTGVGCHALLQRIFLTQDRTCISNVSWVGRQVLYPLGRGHQRFFKRTLDKIPGARMSLFGHLETCRVVAVVVVFYQEVILVSVHFRKITQGSWVGSRRPEMQECLKPVLTALISWPKSRC